MLREQYLLWVIYMFTCVFPTASAQGLHITALCVTTTALATCHDWGFFSFVMYCSIPVGFYLPEQRWKGLDEAIGYRFVELDLLFIATDVVWVLLAMVV